MKRFGVTFLFAVGVAAASLTLQPSAQAGGKCGAKGQPMCPLQGWMEKNVQGPFDKEDLKALEAAMNRAAKLAPDKSWNDGDSGWEKIAKGAAAAAKAGDFKAVRKACKTCHKAWRKKYKAEHREEKLPKGA